MIKFNFAIPFYALIILSIVISGCRKDEMPQIELPFPATYELKSVDIRDGSYQLNVEGQPEQIPHDSFFNQFAAPEYSHEELLNLLRDSLRFASEIDIRSKDKLTFKGISLGLEEDTMELTYRFEGDSLRLYTLTGPISLGIHHEKTDSTLHMYICVYQYTSQANGIISPSPVSKVFVPQIDSREKLLSFVIDEFKVKPHQYVMVIFADYAYELKD